MKRAKGKKASVDEKKQSEDLEISGDFEEIELHFARKACPGGRNLTTEAEERIQRMISSRNVSVSSEVRTAETLYIISYFRYNFYLI